MTKTVKMSVSKINSEVSQCCSVYLTVIVGLLAWRGALSQPPPGLAAYPAMLGV